MTKLRNFSSRFYIIGYLILLISLSACPQKKSSPPIKIGTETYSGSSSSPQYKKTTADLAPWEVWNTPNFRNTFYINAKRNEEEGNLKDASENYSKALNAALTSEEAEYYVLKLSSIDLKLGDEKGALSRISKYADRRKVEANQLDSRFSLLTSYCYLKNQNKDQVLAWALQAYKSSRESGAIAETANSLIKDYIKTLSPGELTELTFKWEKESLIANAAREEKSRRLKGGSLNSPLMFAKYFEESNYKLVPVDRLPNNQLNLPDTNYQENEPKVIGKINQPSNEANYKLAAFLPLSGQYSQHAKRVEEGLRLALREESLEDKLIVLDSEGTIKEKYVNLVSEHNIKFVFGPMLVKEVEQLSELRERLTVPVLTYAKKNGIPSLSENIYRLGGTAENQVLSLISFANSKLNSKKLALLYVESEIGEEYRDALESIKAKSSFSTFLVALPFQPRALSELENLKNRLLSEGFDSVIIADTLPSGEALLRTFKDSADNRINILGVSLLSDIDKINSYRFLLENAYVVSLFNEHSSNAITQKFVTDYRAAFGRDPDILSAQSYDSVKYLISSIKNSSIGINQSIRNTGSVAGVSGTMHLLSDGDIHRDLHILKITRDGLEDLSY